MATQTEFPEPELADKTAKTNLRRGKTTLFPGTPHEKVVETAIHEVKPGGSGKYVATVTSNLGVDDALKLAAQAHGQPEYIPIQQRVAKKLEAGIPVPTPHENGRPVRPGTQQAAAPAAPAAVVPGSADELVAMLRPFDGDTEMQKIITDRWFAKKAAAEKKALEDADKMLGGPAPKKPAASKVEA